VLSVHEPQLQGVQRPENSLKEFKVPKAQEGQHFYTHRGLKSEEDEAKVEAFENLKFFQVLEEKHQSSGGATLPSD
jgi:hypothetical protein